MSMPLLSTVIPAIVACLCLPKDFVTTPVATGQGRLLLFFSNFSEMILPSGVKAYSPAADALSAASSASMMRLISLLNLLCSFS